MGKWTVVRRLGFMGQWAHNGKPLYFWFKDLKHGDATGDGIDALRAEVGRLLPAGPPARRIGVQHGNEV